MTSDKENAYCASHETRKTPVPQMNEDYRVVWFMQCKAGWPPNYPTRHVIGRQSTPPLVHYPNACKMVIHYILYTYKKNVISTETAI